MGSDDMNSPARHRLLSCIAGAAIAVLSATAASAIIYPEKIIGGYYQQTTTTRSTTSTLPEDSGCSNVPGCFFVFDRLPRNKQLIVTNLSCILSVSPGTIRYVSLLLLDKQGSLGTVRRQFAQPVHSDGDSFVLNAATLALFDARERPLLFVQGTANPTTIGGTCSIAGQIIDAP
jgi:hypothetical protein